MVKNSQFLMKNLRKFLGSAGSNLVFFLHVTKKQNYRPLTSSNSNKREENKTDNIYQKVVKL